jgi:hypothetical protein
MGLIGLNEAVQFLTGKELHEDKEAYETGLKIADHMYQSANMLKVQHGLKFTLEETPAESATQKLAKGDLNRFPESRKVIKGDLEKAPYRGGESGCPPRLGRSAPSRASRRRPPAGLLARRGPLWRNGVLGAWTLRRTVQYASGPRPCGDPPYRPSPPSRYGPS